MLLYLAINIPKIPLKAKRTGKKMALSSNFNILAAKKGILKKCLFHLIYLMVCRAKVAFYG